MEKYPDNISAKSGHANSIINITKNKVKLPYELWSMDKIKPSTDSIIKWKQKYKGPYVISAKLDGISALYVNDNNDQKMYTRGNGIYGQDISHLIKYLIPDKLNNITLRGEIIISKDNFNKYYKKNFANPRNFVAGIVNKKSIDPNILKHLDFVIYEIINPQLKPRQQMLELKNKEIKHVKFHTEEDISNTLLSEILLKWRQEYDYEIDGIIVVNDEIYPRPKKNPDYAFAFKMVLSDQVAEAKIVDVLWTPSKDGYLKPRIQIEQIKLGGVTVEYATGFNAKFILDNNIGIGAVITIIRSGDVIPHIINIVTPASNIKFPDVPYKWNATNVDIILDDKDNDITVREKNILAFFKNLAVDGIGPGNIKKIMNSNFDTIPKILAMKPDDYLKVNGFKKLTAEKLYNGIQNKINNASLVDIMTASNVFGRGFGEINLNKILEKYPDILTNNLSKKEKSNQLISIDGIASKTAERFIDQIPEFIKFINTANLENKLTNNIQKNIDNTHPLYNQKIVLTGFRDKELINNLKKIGAEFSQTINKNTFALIVKNINDFTSKIETAHQFNIPIFTLEQFKQKYNI